MEETSVFKSWLWVLQYWILVYIVVTGIAIGVGMAIGQSYYWIVVTIGAISLTAPITYRKLVGGGCSLRFQICALVKGMIAGVAFLALSLVADFILWSILEPSFGWSPLAMMQFRYTAYYIWMLGGMIGGMGARFMEVRGMTMTAESNITVHRAE
ncbi:MAG: hypothetical protein RTU30_07115 [Candidatus Thorarchaeota archaeon]